MEITGSIIANDDDECLTYADSLNTSGALSVGNRVDYGSAPASGGAGYNKITFTASKGWSGSTSAIGNNDTHENRMPYQSVSRWRRTA